MRPPRAAAWPKDCVAVVSILAQHHNDDRVRAGIALAKAGFARPGQIERLARHHGDKADAGLGTWLVEAIDGRLD